MSPAKLNRRTVGKIKAAYPESKAIAELAVQVARLERAVREAEQIGLEATREAEAHATEAESVIQAILEWAERNTAEKAESLFTEGYEEAALHVLDLIPRARQPAGGDSPASPDVAAG